MFTTTQSALTHVGAMAMLAAGIAKAEEIGQPQCIVIVDASGGGDCGAADDGREVFEPEERAIQGDDGGKHWRAEQPDPPKRCAR